MLAITGTGLSRDFFTLWNQKGTNTGSLLFAGKARSYSKAHPNNEAPPGWAALILSTTDSVQ